MWSSTEQSPFSTQQSVLCGRRCRQGIERRSDRTSTSAHPLRCRRQRRVARRLGVDEENVRPDWMPGFRRTNGARFRLRVELYETWQQTRPTGNLPQLLPLRSVQNAKEAPAAPANADVCRESYVLVVC